jgi:hypothetical protein
MTAAPDPAELAPSRDPAAYGRRRILTPAFWAMISLAVLCILAGMAIVSLAPSFRSARTAASAPPPALAPAPPQSPAPSLAAAEPPPPATLPAPEIAALEGRIERIEAGQGRLIEAAAAALAASALGDAAQGPAPFAGELAAYQRLLPASPGARALAPLAAQGAPTRAALAAQLADIGAAIATAARAPGKNASVLDQLLYAVSRVVTVRRIDETGGGPDAALARAERRARGGDLEGALAALQTLPASTRSGPLRAWREAAARRLAIDRDVAAVRQEAMAALEAAREGR